MRTLICATAVVGAVGASAVAGAVTTRPTIDVRTAETRAGTASNPRSVGRLRVTIATPVAPAEAPSVATRAVIHFDRDLVFRTRNFATCALAQIRRDAARCPAGSQVGGGSASVTVFSDRRPALTISPRVTAFNGPRDAARNPRIYLLVAAPQYDVSDVMAGTLRRDTGRYGRRLDVAIPAALRNSPLPGVTLALTRFVVSVGGTRRGTAFVGLRACTGGRLDYRGDFTFTDGRTLSDTSTATCRRR